MATEENNIVIKPLNPFMIDTLKPHLCVEILIAIDQFISCGHVPPELLPRTSHIRPLPVFFPLSRADYSDVAPLGHTMSVLGSRGTLGIRALTRSTPVTVTPAGCCLRSFSVLHRPPPNYPGHIPLTIVERGALAVGSAIGSYLNPRRAGTIMS